MGERKWEPCPFDIVDLPEVAQLGAIVSGEGGELSDMDFLRWQLQYNPAGQAVMWLARHRETGQLAGSYTVIPLQFKIGDQEVTGSLSLNTMTHPDFRKQGIFINLAERTFASCVQAGIPLTIGLPNPLSYPGFIKYLKFADIGHHELFVKPLRPSNILQGYISNSVLRTAAATVASAVFSVVCPRIRSSSSNRSKGILVEKVERFDDRFDDLWLRIRNQKPNMIVRSSAYLNWRFVAAPLRKYHVLAALSGGELCGYMVGVVSAHPRLGHRVAFMVDAVVDAVQNKRAIWKELVAGFEVFALQEHADMIALYVPDNSSELQIMQTMGYRRVPQRIRGSEMPFIVRLNQPDRLAEPQVMNYANWYTTSGDNDRP